MLIFRQLFDPQSSTYSYLLGDPRTREAVLIDPVFDQARRDAALVRELDLVLAATLDTHVHADHVTGAWVLQRRLGSAIALSAASGATGADRYLADGERVTFGDRHLVVRATPGANSDEIRPRCDASERRHSSGSSSRCRIQMVKSAGSTPTKNTPRQPQIGITIRLTTAARP